jgi:hypothetical protein
MLPNDTLQRLNREQTRPYPLAIYERVPDQVYRLDPSHTMYQEPFCTVHSRVGPTEHCPGYIDERLMMVDLALCSRSLRLLWVKLDHEPVNPEVYVDSAINAFRKS